MTATMTLETAGHLLLTAMAFGFAFAMLLV